MRLGCTKMTRVHTDFVVCYLTCSAKPPFWSGWPWWPHLVSSLGNGPPHLILPHFTSPHLSSPHLTSPHLSLNCEGHWGTTDDFTASLVCLPVFIIWWVMGKVQPDRAHLSPGWTHGHLVHCGTLLQSGPCLWTMKIPARWCPVDTSYFTHNWETCRGRERLTRCRQ